LQAKKLSLLYLRISFVHTSTPNSKVMKFVCTDLVILALLVSITQQTKFALFRHDGFNLYTKFVLSSLLLFVENVVIPLGVVPFFIIELLDTKDWNLTIIHY